MSFFKELRAAVRRAGRLRAGVRDRPRDTATTSRTCSGSTRGAAAVTAGSGRANDLSVRLELQADCLAGVWGHVVDQTTSSAPDEVDEALTAAAAIGDDRIQQSTTGRIDPETLDPRVLGTAGASGSGRGSIRATPTTATRSTPTSSAAGTASGDELEPVAVPAISAACWRRSRGRARARRPRARSPNSSPDRYRCPVSGITVTMRRELGVLRRHLQRRRDVDARWTGRTAGPPRGRAGARSRGPRSVEAVTMPSISARSRFGGTMPSPMPGTPCVPQRCSLISGHSAGSTANARTIGSCALQGPRDAA